MLYATVAEGGVSLGVWRYVLVAAGGAAGSAGRYAVSSAVQNALRVTFPWGTAVVNLVGCFAIGLLAGLAEGRGLIGAETRLFLVTGVLGGFTTFSTFGLESVQLLRDGRFAAAAGNVLLQVVVGLAAVVAGHLAAQRF